MVAEFCVLHKVKIFHSHESHNSHEARSHNALHRARSLRGSLQGLHAPRLSARSALKFFTRLTRSKGLYETRPLRGPLLCLLAPKVSTMLVCSSPVYKTRSEALQEDRSLRGLLQSLRGLLARRLSTGLSRSEAH